MGVEERGHVTLTVHILQTLRDLRAGGEEQQDLPYPWRHDLSLGVGDLEAGLVPGGDLRQGGHEAEQLREVTGLQQQSPFPH